MKKIVYALIMLVALLASPLAYAEDVSGDEDIAEADEEIVASVSDADAADTEQRDRRARERFKQGESGPDRLKAQQVSAKRVDAKAKREALSARSATVKERAVLAKERLQKAKVVRAAFVKTKENYQNAVAEYKENPSLETIQDLCSRYGQAHLDKIEALLENANEEDAATLESLQEKIEERLKACANAESEEAVKERISELKEAYQEKKAEVSSRAIGHYLNTQSERLERLESITLRMMSHFEENENDDALDSLDAILSQLEGLSDSHEAAVAELEENGRSREAFNLAKQVRNGLHDVAKDLREIFQKHKSSSESVLEDAQ